MQGEMTALYWQAPSAGPGADPTTPGDSCVENIDARGRQVRWRFGWVAFAFGVALSAALLLAGAGRLWRLAVWLPFAVAGVNWRQALEKT
jgi:hypothetical protein